MGNSHTLGTRESSRELERARESSRELESGRERSREPEGGRERSREVETRAAEVALALFCFHAILCIL
jgi:hypothetical protein